jgi:hypothetical protein
LTSIWSIRSSHSQLENSACSKAESANGSATPPSAWPCKRVLQERGELLGRRRGAAVDVRDVGGHAEDVGAQADLGDVGLAVAVLEAVVLGDAVEAGHEAGDVLGRAGRGERVAQRGQLLIQLVLEGAQRQVHAADRPLARRQHAAAASRRACRKCGRVRALSGLSSTMRPTRAGPVLGERGDLLVGAPHGGHGGAARELGLLGLDLEQQALGADVLDEGDRRGALDLEVAVADRLRRSRR